MIRRASSARLDEAAKTAELATSRERAATMNARRLSSALDVLPEGVVVCGDDGEVLYRNTAAHGLVEPRGADILVARAVDELLVEARRGVPQERTLELFGPPARTLMIDATPIDGGTVAVIRDVTERRHLDAVRRDFVANVSHELRTPVGALAVLAETLADEDDPEVVRRLAVRVSKEVARAEEMITDLLDLSRIESDAGATSDRVAVDDIVASAVDRVADKATERDVSLEIAEVPTPVAIAGRRGELVSAVANLLSNAVGYSDPGSLVHLSVMHDGEWVDFIVRDEGIGIPSKELERIFERFYRVDRARSRDTGGTGLGLAIVRHAAHNHGGTVTVASHEGEGSTFVLRLPSMRTP